MSQLENGEIFTNRAVEVLEKSTQLAVKLEHTEVTPEHMMLVLLCGASVDLDALDNGFSPDQPSHLWSVIQDEHVEALNVARKIKANLKQNPPRGRQLKLGPTGTSAAEVPRAQTPKGSHWWKRNGTASDSVTHLGVYTAIKREHSASRTRKGDAAEPAKPTASRGLVKVFQNAQELMEPDLLVSPYHLSIAIVNAPEISSVLEDHELSAEAVVKSLKDLKRQRITNKDDDGFKYLSRYAIDMLDLARNNKLDETIGRDEEIRRTIQILCRRTKNSVVLLGEPGVGKTAVAEGLAQRMAAGQVPQNLKGTLYSLDLGALFAGAGKGEYEERVKGVIDDVKRSQESQSPAILFIDELHLISVGKGGNQAGMDAANLLKPELARGQFRCIGATTLAEYREHIEKDGALTRRFAQVMVNEPTLDQAKTILRGSRERYENHHNVWIMDQAIVAAVDLSHRYLTARRLPDSAFDLIDEACASARVQQDLEPESIEELEQAVRQHEAYIRSLERDSHDSDSEALLNAKQTLVALQARSSSLKHHQSAIAAWWKLLVQFREQIREKKKEISQERSAPRIDTKKINRGEDELKRLRDQLVAVEHKRPNIQTDAEDTRYARITDRVLHPLLARKQSVFPATSPDIITPESIAVVIEKMTKIPVRQLLDSDKDRLLHLRGSLESKVIGQPEAIAAVTSAIQISRTGLGNANRPIASLLFTGASGTGKTLLAKTLAEELFGQSSAMIRIDGSEYSESHSVSRLIGAPPGYVGFSEGGQLTEYVRRSPYCIVLLDEIEKTCAAFWTVFLQVMDDGRLTDGQGRLVDFRNTVIIMTSNVGADILSKQSGSISSTTRDAVIQRFKDKGFPLEFLNRIDEVVTFRTMSRTMMGKVLDKHLVDLKLRDGLKKMTLDLDPAAKEWLIERGISPEYGARLLTRVIQTDLLNQLARAILEKRVKDDSVVLIRVKGDRSGLSIESSQQH